MMCRLFALWVCVVCLIPSNVVGADQEIVTLTLTYKKVGDCEIRADIYSYPATNVTPAVVLIHGGALIMGDRQMLGNQIGRRMVRQVLDAGLKVVSIDYRLAPETKLPAIVQDVQDAFRWIRKEGPTKLVIDGNRLAAVGHSAGGYLSLMAGSSVVPPPQADRNSVV